MSTGERIVEVHYSAGGDISMYGFIREEVVRCRDCKHGHITIDGKHNKWCSLLATHDTNGDNGDQPDGYDPEPYFDSDFYCAWGERRGA